MAKVTVYALITMVTTAVDNHSVENSKDTYKVSLHWCSV